MIPGTLKVYAEHQKLRAFRLTQRRSLLSVNLREFCLQFSNHLQAFVPPTLQLGGNVSIFRVHRIVLSLGSIALVAGLLKSKLDLSSTVTRFGFVGLDRLERGLYTQRLK
jgi:hypothetical protein